MTLGRIVTIVAASCAALVIVASPGLSAQASHQQHAVTAKAKPASGMAAKDHAMMAEREKMMADMKVADQRLDDLVATMNAASGPEKMAATATVVTEMVTQRRAMQAGMMKMHEGMMSHMMEHMQAGKESMAMCPMMKSKPMGDMKKN